MSDKRSKTIFERYSVLVFGNQVGSYAEYNVVPGSIVALLAIVRFDTQICLIGLNAIRDHVYVMSEGQADYDTPIPDEWPKQIPRQLVDDDTYPSQWLKKGEHEGHEVRWKDGVSNYGVHGVAVGVDFDICIADGICISVCSAKVFEKFDIPAEQEKIDRNIPNDSGKTLLDRWKADPAGERDCTFCRACAIQCPVQAIKITQGVGPFA
jgi:NAD-dependent dihydropyrimidine dehydrogenase PreA subunit